MEQNLPIYKPDFSKLRDDGVQVIWIGHSTVLVRLDGITVLTDPVFSTDTKRYRDPPCSVDGKSYCLVRSDLFLIKL